MATSSELRTAARPALCATRAYESSNPRFGNTDGWNFFIIYLEEEDNRRLFYEIDRVTAGLRWATEWLDVSVGVGYALDHRYRAGWDIRDLETVRDLSEELYASFSIEGTFP